MGETSDIQRPIWRTPLALAIVAWIVTALAATLAAPRLMEAIPDGAGPLVLLAAYVVPPPILLAWSFWAMVREPVTGWLAPTVLMAFLGGFVPAFPPLLDAGVRLNFQTRRPAYEVIVAEARAGKLAGAERSGWVVGARNDIHYRYRAADPGRVDFVWVDSFGFKAGVRYDDSPCVARPGLSCVDRGEPLTARYSYYARFF